MPSFRMIAPVLVLALGFAAAARADDSSWPREFGSSSGSFVIYQPQPEDLNGDVLTGRAAFSLQRAGSQSPTFGVLWFTEQIEIDRDSLSVAARNFDVTKVRLPSVTPEEASRYEHLVEAEAAKWDLSGSLEELQSGLAATEKERASVAGLDNTPPRIIFSSERALLVVYDGAPALEAIQSSRIQRVANTPYAVVYNPDDRTYYLNGASLWYRARDPLGPWTDISRPPSAVRDVVPPDTSSDDAMTGPPPRVLTATEPTELISTDGPPRYAPLVDDELLYVTNTESDVVREVSSQALYVLLAGRWYRSETTAGPWTFVRGDQLPESFQKVPPDSPKGNILASVAGTDQAEDAIADAEIPQTSAIQRDDRSFDVDYDGPAEFSPIAGTRLQYAVNTDAEVILAGGSYYACDQGVWYVSNHADGPWIVSDTRPLGVEDIPPDCPVYDVRYVDIYDATPTVVYVGYLPGYLGCYPYYGTVVYGTGYRYRSWRSRSHYYPRPCTWGFQARYNPWLSRWSFGFSYATGFLRVGTRWRAPRETAQVRARALWFGPGGYRRPLVGKDMALLRTRPPGRLRARVADRTPMNVYNRSENIPRVDRTVRGTFTPRIAPPGVRPARVPNDVFAGQDGKVYQRDTKGKWKVNEGRGWQPARVPAKAPNPVTPVDRGSTRPPETRPSRPPANPQPPIEQPRERREPRHNTPATRPAPPTIRSTPGDLESEYRARQRGGHAPPPVAEPPAARPTPHQEKGANEGARPERPTREKKDKTPDEKTPTDRRR
ncbi:MAG TPA: carbohydrate-binding family V/XII [Candidatus Binatia bacterium]|nr:carbohydrate-binding family V/XII [Candidatus Binatia bacterium]